MEDEKRSSSATNLHQAFKVNQCGLHLVPRETLNEIGANYGGSTDMQGGEVALMGMAGTAPIPLLGIHAQADHASLWGMGDMALIYARIEQMYGDPSVSPRVAERFCQLVEEAKAILASVGVWAVDVDQFKVEGMAADLTPEQFGTPGDDSTSRPADTQGEN